MVIKGTMNIPELVEEGLDVTGAVDVPEVFDSTRFILDIDARYVSSNLSTKEFWQNILGFSAFHLLLHSLHEFSGELLHVLLFKNMPRLPAEGFCKLICADGII